MIVHQIEGTDGINILDVSIPSTYLSGTILFLESRVKEKSLKNKILKIKWKPRIERRHETIATIFVRMTLGF